MRYFFAIAALLTGVFAPVSGARASQPPTQTVVLLTSLNFEHLPEFLRDKFWNYHLKLERVFRNKFKGTGYRLVVKNHVNFHDVHETLRSPENVAVFFVSHGAVDSLNLRGGAGIKPMLADEQGFDITEAFAAPHPNLRFLGLVACDSMRVIEQLKLKTAVHGFNGIVDAKNGLAESIRKGFSTLRRYDVSLGYQMPCEQREGVSLKIVRRLRPAADGMVFKNYPSVRVRAHGKVIASFPAVRTRLDRSSLWEQAQVAWVDHVPRELVVDAGNNMIGVPDGIEIGRLEFAAPSNAELEWKVMSRPDGSPFGVTKHVYRIARNGGGDVERFYPYRCQPMPPVALLKEDPPI